MSRIYTVDDTANIIMGSFIEGAKTSTILNSWHADRKKEVRSAATKFNDAIRQNSPSIALLDPELIADTILDVITHDPKKYVASISLGIEDAPYFSGDKGFEDQVDKYLSINHQVLHNKIADAVRKELLSSLSTITLKQIQTTLLNISKNVSITNPASMSIIGANLRKELVSIGVVRITDIASFISNVGNRVGVMAPGFNRGVEESNKLIKKAIISVMKTTDISLSSNLEIGSLVHAGHVGFYKEDKSLIGINTPGALVYGLASDRFDKIEQSVGNIKLHVDSGVTVTSNFTDFANLLLSLGFNITVSMEDFVNSGKLSSQEVKEMEASLTGITKARLQEVLETKIGKGALNNILINIRKSPTLLEYITNQITNRILGVKTPSSVGAKTASKGKTIGSTYVPSVNAAKKTNKSTATSSTRSYYQNKITSSRVNLSSLLALINSNLQNVISANMGGGNESRVLNYRTGRFAASAKVERLSESRAGMITAFYSYMKNPYQTFEPGFAQGSPASRNPRNLIGTSIRDIAATKVANQLRAISV